jgi:hypothetical protein
MAPFRPASLELTSNGGEEPAGRAGIGTPSRQPEHVILAGNLGLGIFDQRGIEYRRVLL